MKNLSIINNLNTHIPVPTRTVPLHLHDYLANNLCNSFTTDANKQNIIIVSAFQVCFELVSVNCQYSRHCRLKIVYLMLL